MSHHAPTLIDPLGLATAALAQPLTSLLAAVVVTLGVVAFTPHSRAVRRVTPAGAGVARSAEARHLPERRALGVTAIAMLVAFVGQAVGGVVGRPDDAVSWWRYVLPLGVSAIGLIVLAALIVLRGTRAPQAPTMTTQRRTWWTFAPRWGVAAAAAAFVTLLITTVGAGLSSSPDGRGRYVWLELPVPNEPSVDPIRVWFYGWAYGLPVMLGLGGLLVVTLTCLQANAVRPYIRPETVGAERVARREVSSGTMRIMTASIVLALAAAWRLIGDAGSVSGLVVEGVNGGASYDVAWRYGEVAAAAGWCAPVLETAALVLLLFATRLLRRREALDPHGSATDPTALVGAVR
ncbi:hypothetical protein [Microbacterium sp. Marseille-Q6965]|uniref:hypothetical protein n=1 Tax=Microbacterium sp. Marseille-Q6965 TaxID=2965072 RepID=UPI0021B7CA55|nr:hypothetical protein [Microbacterium sp. Marseille-Q6965]